MPAADVAAPDVKWGREPQWPTNLLLLLNYKVSWNNLPLLLGGSGTIDQSWSIGIELTFYFMIIILLIIDLRKGLYFCFGASLSYFIAHCLLMKNFQDGYDNGIYKDSLSSAWMFCLGGIAYFHRPDVVKSRMVAFASAVAMATCLFFSRESTGR